VLREVIGLGGMGEVWRGEHEAQGVPVAVKVITADAARDAETVAAFRNEVRAVARLEHPGIVRVFDCGEVDAMAAFGSAGGLHAGSPWLAMELLSAGSLDAGPPPRSWAELRETLLSLLDALAHAHARGVLHRDLKPHNILRAGPDNERPGLRLLDFGIAHALGAEDTGEGAGGGWGTPHYMAPEQHHGSSRDYGPWTDLYSLGCIAWELACGERPFPGDSVYAVVFGHLNHPPPAFQPRLEVPPALQDWIRRLLEKEPRDRFRRAADAAFALRELEEPQVWGVPPLPEDWRGDREGARPSMRLVGAGLGLHGLRTIPLLGRDEQRDSVWQALSEVWSLAAPRLVLLHGAAGCGKTRLAEWLCERADEAGGATVLRGAYDPMGGPGSGLAAVLQSAMGCAGLARAEATRRVKELLRRDGVTDEYETLALVELMAPSEDWAELDTARRVRFGDPRERNALLQRFLLRRAAERPVILWLDDVQWGAPALSLAEQLLDALPQAAGPILLLFTARDEALQEQPQEAKRLAELLARPGVRSLAVAPLGHEECGRLVRDVLGLDGELARAVETRSAGNPLYAVQLVGDWVQRGLLRPGERGFVLADPDDVELPQDIHQIWAERLVRVLHGRGHDARATLELAAALGSQVDAFEWNHACGEAGFRADPEIIDTLFVAGLADPTDVGWSFRSELLRESLERGSRAAGRWRELNAACAAMLERRYGQGRAGFHERLALHRVAAGQIDAGIELLREAVHELLDANEYRRAEQLISIRERALTEARAAEADPRWGECMLFRSGVNMETGRLPDAQQGARQAEAESRRHGWADLRARALGQLGVLARLRGDIPEAVRILEEALACCPSEDAATRGRVLYYLGAIKRQACDFDRARRLYERARVLYAEAGHTLGEAQCRLGMAHIAQDTGDLNAAEALFEELVEAFGRLGNRFGQAAAQNGIAAVAHLRGNLDVARDGFQAAWELLVSIGSPAAIASGLNVALIFALRRDWDELRRVLHAIDSQGSAAAQRPWLGQLLIYRLPLAAVDGDWPGWDRTLANAEQLLRERAGAPQDIATVARIAGDLAVERGEADRARAAYLVAREQWELLDEDAGITVIDGLISRLPAAAR
jgi:tetratricopeptide (TPR) repeat protein